MSDNDNTGCLMAIVAAVTFAVISCLFVHDIDKGMWEREAVKTGHTEYVLDQKTGVVTWRWK